MDTLAQDLRFAFRTLLKNRAFTTIAVLTLALGIGANTAIFSVVNAVLLRQLAFKSPEQLLMVWEKNVGKGGEIPSSFPNFLDIKSAAEPVADVGAFTDATFNLTGGDQPDRVIGLRVSSGLFQLVGVEPLKGRTFSPDEDKPGTGNVLVLSYGLWQRRFGGNPNIVGQPVQLDGQSYNVIGIMPPDFKFPPSFTATIASSQFTMPNAELWVPLTTDALPMERGLANLFMVGRLKPGINIERAQAEMNVIANRLETEYIAQNKGMGIHLTPLSTQVTGDIRLALIILVGAVGFVLLIACANVANLLLVKAAQRQKEIAIRTALGARRIDVIRQLLTESLVLGLLGGLPGLLLAALGIRLLVAFTPVNVPHLKDVGLDFRVLLFTLLISIITPIIFGLVPALQASRPDLTETLKEGGRSSSGGARINRVSSLLVVSEVALALVLLVASGLMIKSLLRLQHVNPGFNPDSVITLELALPQSRYPEKFQQLAFQQQLLKRIGELPGVRTVGTVDNLPFSGNESNSSFTVEGRPIPDPAQRPRAFYRVISVDYLQTMGIPIRSGRTFNDHDTSDLPAVAIINESAARRFFPNEDPVGKRIKKGRPESKNPWRTIVGVVGSVSHTALNIEPQPEIYEPYLQNGGLAVTLVTRSESAEQNFGAVRNAVLALDKDLPVSGIKLMTSMISDSYAQPLLYTFLLAIFASVALVLAAVGVYGVISYSVSQRTQEMGLRLALGAQRLDIIRLVVGRAILLVTIGLAIGLGLALVLLRLMSNLLYGVGASDPITLSLVCAFLLAVGFVASLLPAHRASGVHPMVALRHE